MREKCNVMIELTTKSGYFAINAERGSLLMDEGNH
jgi:hypothetical protein